MLSRAAFPKQLGSDNADLEITLKYPCKAYDGSVVWAGLRVTKDSADTWCRLLSKNSEVIELRVFMEDITQDQSIGPPITGSDGISLNVVFYRSKGSSWTTDSPIPAPTNYKVSFHLFNF